MKVEIDSFLQIGYSHDICEDYIRHGTLDNDDSYVVLADGCSSASDTDIGSRLMVLERIRQLRIRPNEIFLNNPSFINICIEKGRSFDLEIDNFSATLLSVTHRMEGKFIVEMYGDGCYIARKRTGEIEIYRRTFTSGAPYYLMYGYDERLKSKYLERFPGNVITEKIVVNGDSVTKTIEEDIEVQFYEPNGEVALFDDEYDMVAVTSDGVESFNKKLSPVDKINFIDVVKQCFSIKSFSGEFVKRRCKRFNKDFEKNGYGHYDDFSFGAIYIEEEK